MINKILNINELISRISFFKKRKKKIVLCHGVFDLLHIGHINHFEQAKSFGDILVVSITADNFVNKGPGRPTFNQNERSRAISFISCVDYVFINNESTATNLISFIKPNVYCKGPDYKNNSKDITKEIFNEKNAVQKIGGKIHYTSGETYSSSSIINSTDNSFSANQKKSLQIIKKKYNFSDLEKKINNFNKLEILIIGEAVIDEYVFCDALGKSGKEPVLALKELKSERYLGGSLAIASHISQFSKNVTVLSLLGEKKEFLNEIKKKIDKNVKFNFITKKNSPTILKKRFIDYVSYNKILGVYDINDDPLDKIEEKKLINTLKKIIPNFDLIIVADYGHGFISSEAAKIISKKSKFLAVNAQLNAANIGHHSISKYQNLECIVINEKEIRHELRDRKSDLEILMLKLSKKQHIKNLVVTRGKDGAIFYNKKNNLFKYSDGFAKKVVDKIGAGDAMLSIIALCLKSKINYDATLLLGSFAGAYSTETIGNKEPISKIKILKSLDHILK